MSQTPKSQPNPRKKLQQPFLKTLLHPVPYSIIHDNDCSAVEATGVIMEIATEAQPALVKVTIEATVIDDSYLGHLRECMTIHEWPVAVTQMNDGLLTFLDAVFNVFLGHFHCLPDAGQRCNLGLPQSSPHWRRCRTSTLSSVRAIHLTTRGTGPDRITIFAIVHRTNVAAIDRYLCCWYIA